MQKKKILNKQKKPTPNLSAASKMWGNFEALVMQEHVDI